MPTLTIRIDNTWYSMSRGKVAKAETKTAARTRLQNNAAINTKQPDPETNPQWTPVMRISEQIAYEAKQRLLEAATIKEILPA